MEKKLLKKYYLTSIEPYPGDPKRQQLSFIPMLVFAHPQGGTTDRSCHLTWYTDAELYHVWRFDHMTIVTGSLDILTDLPDFIAEIASINKDTQPQDFEPRLQKLGFHRH